jgi:hypothetical protein
MTTSALPFPGLVPEVRGDLENVRDAGRSQRVALRGQPTRDVHWCFRATPRGAAVDEFSGHAGFAEAQVVIVDELARWAALVAGALLRNHGEVDVG